MRIVNNANKESVYIFNFANYNIIAFYANYSYTS